MGLKLRVQHLPCTQVLPQMQHHCIACQASTQHRVTRLYTTTYLALMPLFSYGTEHRYDCCQCGAGRTDAAPLSAPNRPFFHRFGCLVLLALLVLWGGGSWLWSTGNRLAGDWKREELKPMREEARALAKEAQIMAEAVVKTCKAVKETLPLGRLSLPAQKPADPASLLGAPYFKRENFQDYEFHPQSRYFGPQTCIMAEVPKDIEHAADYGKLPEERAALDVFLAKTRALKEQLTPIASSTVMVIVDVNCLTDKRNMCLGNAVWLSTVDKKVQAVVQVEVPSEVVVGDKSGSRLAQRLAEETEKW